MDNCKKFKDNNKLMSLGIDNDKLLEKYKTILTKIEDLKNIELNALPAYDDSYIKTKIRKHFDKVYTDFPDLNMPEVGVECESLIIIPIDSLLIYKNKYYLQMYTGNCAHEIVNAQMIDYLDDNVF